MENKTYKVLFADDEYWTREKIRVMIPWQDYGLVFLEPAVDGEDVLNKVREHHPDILITDINMPFLNGIELLWQLQQESPDIVTFVVSGYDDFDYVKDAFMAGAVNYLIKPVTKIDLVNAIIKSMERIGERENERQKLKKAASLIEDREFSQLIERKEQPFMPGITAGDEMGIVGRTLVLIKFHNIRAILELDNNGQFAMEFKQEIKSIFQKQEIIVFHNDYRFNEFIIITHAAQGELKEYVNQIARKIREDGEIKYTICITEQSYSIASIHTAYVEAISLLMRRKVKAPGEIIFADAGATEHSKPMVKRLGREQEKLLRNYLGQNNITGIRDKFFESIRKQAETLTYLELKQIIKQTLAIIEEYVFDRYPPEKAAEFETIAELSGQITESLDEAKIRDYFAGIMELLIIARPETASDTMKQTVHRVADYIESHYNMELSLTSLAEKFHVDPTYLSKIFSQEIGENLITYITNKRTEQAKLLMKDENINLSEIAFMVGYDDYTYFSRVFKKRTGYSPREYRSQVSK
ncbi:MAG: response regulator transcription factor [Lachnospiraceae bacterium]